MKKFIIMYAIFSFILLVFIFMFTLIQESNSRSLDLFYELSDTALETNDLDEFVRYQSVAYQLISVIETDDYGFHIYQVIAQIDGEYKNQFSVFVIPKNDVNHADALSDTSDQTGIILINHDTSTAIYQTSSDPDYDDYAVSYGITRIGFYYYAIILDEDYVLDLSLVDYDGQSILSEIVLFNYIDYDENNLGTLSLGFTDTEIEAMLDLPTYIQPALLENIALFLVVDILVGGVIHFILKRKIL